MSDNHLIMLVMMEARTAIKPEDSLEDRCRAAMKAAKGHWMVLDENLQFQGAVAAVLETANEEEEARIMDSLHALKTLNALLNGVSVDLDGYEAPTNPLGLNKIWQEVTA